VAKICIIGPSKKYFSGISAHTIYLANAFCGENRVSALTMRNLLPRFLYPGNKNVGREDFTIEFKPEVTSYQEIDWNSPWSWIKAYRFLKKERPDFIVMAWWTSAVAHMELLLATINSWNIKAKLILDMHEIVDPLENSKSVLRFYSRVMGRLIMNRTDAFVVHSATVKEQALNIYQLKADKVFVIPIGVYDHNCESFTRESARVSLGIKEDFTILYFGMIRKYKGVPFLVQAFDKLPSEIVHNSRLMIAGEDWGDEKELGKLIAESPNFN
jgi:glycosyltransferase involved in cell wall biosynthesis